jgi:hypothetical protein
MPSLIRPGRTHLPFITLSFLAVATLSPAAAKDATPPVEIVTEEATDMEATYTMHRWGANFGASTRMRYILSLTVGAGCSDRLID